ncbi:MAG: hypothetical protein WAO02_18085 [Verrucomicrobiia bacterium]
MVIRTQDKFISAGLELECQRAFAVIFENELKDPKTLIRRERMELDVLFLRKMNEFEYLYKKLVELPERSRSTPVRLNLESDRDSRIERPSFDT